MKFHVSSMLPLSLSCGVLLITSACQPSDDDTTPSPSPLEPTPEITPTPTPGPSPTPAPDFGGEFRVGSFLIAPTDTGFDLNGDSSPDNVLPSVFDELYAAFEEAIYTALSKTKPDEAAQLTEQLMTKLEENGLVIKADTVNGYTTSAIASGKLNYLLSLEGAYEASNLSWYEGFVNGQGSYVVTDTAGIGVQGGPIDTQSMIADLGPGTFRYRPVNADGVSVLDLEVINALTTFTLDPHTFSPGSGHLNSGLLGGAIPWTAIETLMLDALALIEQFVDIDAEGLMAEIKSRLEVAGLLDVTVQNEDAFSCAFLYSAYYQTFLKP